MSHAQTVEEIQNAIRAHGKWKLRLKSAISTGSSDVGPDVVACDNLCDFGKWLHSDSIPADLRASAPYGVIKRLHAEFHQTAASVLKDALAGNTKQSQALLEGRFDDQSRNLIAVLSKWKGELRAN